jgi:hypothetical protein
MPNIPNRTPRSPAYPARLPQRQSSQQGSPKMAKKALQTLLCFRRDQRPAEADASHRQQTSFIGAPGGRGTRIPYAQDGKAAPMANDDIGRDADAGHRQQTPFIGAFQGRGTRMLDAPDGKAGPMTNGCNGVSGEAAEPRTATGGAGGTRCGIGGCGYGRHRRKRF